MVKAVVASGTGCQDDYGKLFREVTDRPRPKRGKDELLVRVMAVSLAPGDVRTLSGNTSLVQKPRDGWPMVPGGDLCGVVDEADPDSDRFKVGDEVVARFMDTPEGALAEFAVVKTAVTGHKPKAVSWAEAAAVPASVVVAQRTARKWVRKGDRVLVLGGAGGVGAHLVQMLKERGAKFVAATTKSHTDLFAGMADVDRVIDYSKERWHEVDEFVQDPLDLIIDLASPGGHGEAYGQAKAILKSAWKGGRFCTLVGPCYSYMIQTIPQALTVAYRVVLEGKGTMLLPFLPSYKWDIALGTEGLADEYTEVFQRVAEGRLKIVLDPAGPFPFTAEGVANAFSLVESRRARGKVVIRVGGST